MNLFHLQLGSDVRSDVDSDVRSDVDYDLDSYEDMTAACRRAVSSRRTGEGRTRLK